jgi:hypothetical protein
MNLQPAIEAIDAFIAMHNLIGDIITNLPDILVELNDESVTGACFKLMEVDGPQGREKKGLITVFSEVAPMPLTSCCTITELQDEPISTIDISHGSALIPSDSLCGNPFDPVDDHDASDAAMSDDGLSYNTLMHTPAPAGKKQENLVKDVREVRRSQRIAKIFDGYKAKAATDLAKGKSEMDNSQHIVAKGKKKQAKQANKDSKKIISKAFSTEIIDSDAPAPPELPISIVQCIGVEHCMIPPSEVSTENLTTKPE